MHSMIILQIGFSVERAYQNINPTDYLHAVDELNHSFGSSTIKRVVLARADLRLCLSGKGWSEAN